VGGTKKVSDEAPVNWHVFKSANRIILQEGKRNVNTRLGPGDEGGGGGGGGVGGVWGGGGGGGRTGS